MTLLNLMSSLAGDVITGTSLSKKSSSRDLALTQFDTSMAHTGIL